MRKLLLLMVALAMTIPIWASEHTVTINRGEVLEHGNVSGVLAYYCVKDGIMMTFTDGLDNENYLVERRNLTFEVRSANYIIRKIVMHCVDNVLEGDPNFYWGPTTISVVNNFTYPGQLGNYYITNDGYDGVWEGQTSALQFTTSSGKPVRFGSVEITYDKLDGDIFELVTNNSQIVEGQTYVIASQYHDKVMAFKKTDDASYPVTNVVKWMNADKTKVKVNGNACLFKMENVKDSAVGDYTRKVAWFNTLNGHIREGSGTNEANLINTTSLSDYARAIMYISATENNYLCWFKQGTGSSTRTIRYDYDDSKLLKVMSYSDPDTRVWLYKLAQSYNITTQCEPGNGGSVTLGNGVVNGTSQEGENVNFHVGTNWGYRIRQVTVTNSSTGEVTVLSPSVMTGDGNDYYFVMPAADVTIRAEFYETEPDLYLLGTAMGRTGWVPAGPKFDYDPVAEEYHLDVYFKGGNDNASADQAYGYFSLSKGIDTGIDWTTASSGDGNWTPTLNDNRLAAQYNNYDFPNGMSNVPLYAGQGTQDNAFKIPAGVYRITVNRAMTSMSIEEIPLQLTFTPVSGTEVVSGQEVSFTSDLESTVHAIASQYDITEVGQTFQNSLDNWATSEDGNTAVITEDATTVYGKAIIGYIVVPGTATYTIAQPTEFTISTSVYPAAGGSVEVASTAMAGETVTFTVTTNIGYLLTNVTVTGTNTTQQTPVTDNGDGTYSFVMPNDNVVIRIVYSHNGHSLHRQCIPAEGGRIEPLGSPNATYYVNYSAWFTIYANEGYDFESVEVINETTGEPVEFERTTVSSLSYKIPDFPDANVLIKAYFVPHAFTISTECDPAHGGSINLLGDAEDGKEAAGRTITFSVETAELGFTFSSVDVTDSTGQNVDVTDNGDGTFSFVMPESDVTVTAHFDEKGEIFRLVTSDEQIVEGKTYAFISQDFNNSMKYLGGKYGTICFASTQPIMEWVTPDKRRVKVGGQTAFFETKNVSDTVWGWDSTPYKVLSLTNRGRRVIADTRPQSPLNYFLVISDEPSPSGLSATADRFVMKINRNGTYDLSSSGVGLYYRTLLGYYEPLDEFRYFNTNASSSSSINKVWLYKLAEPYNITTVCDPDDCGQITLSGDVTDNTALDGGTVLVTTTPVEGYALQTLTVTVDGTGQELKVTDNGDGTFSFVMPIGDVTVTAHFEEGYAISTVCVPSDGGVITVANMAEDGETVDFTVTPYPGWVITSVITTIDGQETNVELTQGNDGAYSFVMPDASVTITANFEREGYVLRRVERTEEILEGKTYTIIATNANKVLNKVLPDDVPNYFTSTDIVEWLNSDRTLVKVDDRACLFTFDDLTLGHNHYGSQTKDAYFKTDGGYIGYWQTDNPDEGFLTLEPTKDGLKMFSSSIGGFSSFISYYDVENNGSAWREIYFDGENERFVVRRGWSSIYDRLYKIAEPYTIALECEPEGCGTMALTGGAIGNTALEGSLVTVMPDPAQGYATISVTVAVDDTDETLEAIINVDGSYSFVMPTGNVTVTAYFGTGYDITTVCDPADGGVITCRESAPAGEWVDFAVDDNYGFAFTGVTVTYLDENNQEVTVDVDYRGDGSFGFEMPSAPVTITASFVPNYYSVWPIVNPDDGGYIDFWGEDGHEINSISDVLFEAGSTVTFTVNTHSGYVIDNVVVTIDGTDQEIVPIVEVETYSNEQTVESYAEYTFVMPEGNVTITVDLELTTPLRFIENQTSFIKNETEVTVTDELIGTWMAQQYVWAKDQSLSNEYFEMNQNGNVYDYVRTILGWQTREWDQSNWVMLDFSEIPGFDWNSVEGRKEMKKYVDHKIKAGTIKGTYYCNGNSYDEWAQAEFIGKTNHRIVLSELPDVIVSDETQGYPGYIPDPREEEDLDYRYNHYVSANFFYLHLLPGGVNYWKIDEGDEEEDVDYVFYLDNYYPPLEQYDSYLFFMKPKNQEVAQVWGVWAGTMTYEDLYRGVEVTKDVFQTFIPNASVTPNLNTFGIPGVFAVEHWDYNRLPSPDESPVYGKPGVDSDPDDALHLNEAYLFHIAIQYDVTAHDEEPSEPNKAPAMKPKKARDGQAPQATDYPAGFYRIYPLDLGNHRDSYTSVHEVKSITSTEIDSIRYYNVMGQESETPFDGINIMVIRYKDGSFTSRKVMR